MKFLDLGLSPHLCNTVAELGYSVPTPVQRLALPQLLARKDLIAIAQTGTGKTAAFALPMIQNLLATPAKAEKAPRALILTPTRELALQVYGDIMNYAKDTGLDAVVLHGGVSYGPQTDKLEAGTPIIIATPGRLRDHLERQTLKLSELEVLILDEADRMLDMGFSEDVGVIVSKTPKSRQTLLFSATFSDEVRRLAQQYLVKPASIEVTPEKVTAANVTHVLHPTHPERKLDLLFEVIHKNLDRQILVFTRTKDRADEVAKDLISRGLVCMATHGDRTQAHRTKALARFKEGKIQVLVATDIAARGLDTTELSLVINYELPNLPEDYVHRIGRTGRAGRAGSAVSLVTQFEVNLLGPIEDLIKFRIPVVDMPGFTPTRFDPRPKSGVKRKEPQRPPAPRWGASRREAPYRESPRKDGPRRDGARAEAPRRDGPRNDAPRRDGTRAEAPRRDSPRKDAPRRDGARAEAPRRDGPRKDAPRRDGARAEAPRRDGPRKDAPRRAGARAEAPRQDRPRKDAPHRDGPQSDVPRREGPRRKGR